jgi:hypothetical protein
MLHLHPVYVPARARSLDGLKLSRIFVGADGSIVLDASLGRGRPVEVTLSRRNAITALVGERDGALTRSELGQLAGALLRHLATGPTHFAAWRAALALVNDVLAPPLRPA